MAEEWWVWVDPLMLMLMLINGSHSQSHGWEASVQGLYCICTSLTYSPLLMKNLVWQIFFCTDILCQRYRIVPAVVLISWFTWSPPLWKANSRVRTSFHVRRDLSFLRFQIIYSFIFFLSFCFVSVTSSLVNSCAYYSDQGNNNGGKTCPFSLVRAGMTCCYKIPQG